MANYSVSGLSNSIDITAFKVTIFATPTPISFEFANGFDVQLRRKRSNTRNAFDAEESKYRKFGVVSRYSLRKNDSLRGPILIQEIESTTVLPSGYHAKVDASHNLVISKREAI